MAFDDLTAKQRKLITDALELLETGKYSPDLPVYMPDHGNITLCLKGSGIDEKVLQDFGETDLVALEQAGYITLVRKKPYDPCDRRAPQYIVGLKLKAYLQLEASTLPEDDRSSSINRLLSLLSLYST